MAGTESQMTQIETAFDKTTLVQHEQKPLQIAAESAPGNGRIQF
jgi:hypothetical protein